MVENQEDYINTLRLRQNGLHFPDHIFRCTFVNEKFCILIETSPKFVPKGLIDNNLALAKKMAWHCPVDKTLSEPMMVS